MMFKRWAILIFGSFIMLLIVLYFVIRFYFGKYEHIDTENQQASIELQTFSNEWKSIVDKYGMAKSRRTGIIIEQNGDVTVGGIIQEMYPEARTVKLDVNGEEMAVRFDKMVDIVVLPGEINPTARSVSIGHYFTLQKVGDYFLAIIERGMDDSNFVATKVFVTSDKTFNVK